MYVIRKHLEIRLTISTAHIIFEILQFHLTAILWYATILPLGWNLHAFLGFTFYGKNNWGKKMEMITSTKYTSHVQRIYLVIMEMITLLILSDKFGMRILEISNMIISVVLYFFGLRLVYALLHRQCKLKKRKICDVYWFIACHLKMYLDLFWMLEYLTSIPSTHALYNLEQYSYIHMIMFMYIYTCM